VSKNPLLPQVIDKEFLARFILFGRWVRSSDSTVRPDAFIPYPYPDLSVTRHIGLSVDEIWQLGQAVADSRPAMLHGRADIQALHVKRQFLRIVPTPEPKNHANIIGWPKDKPAQKIIAQELAAAAHYMPKPMN
jgi:hypothetical protein